MEHVIEISQERFFQQLVDLDDNGYWNIGASERREGEDSELGLEEVKSWPNCRYFAVLPKDTTHILDFYVIRPVDGEPLAVHGETKWYYFRGNGWEVEPKEGEKFVYPDEVSCLMFGNHLKIRYVNIDAGSGFEADYPFEDLVKIFSHLRDIYRALDKSDIRLMTFDLKVVSPYPGDEEFCDSTNHVVNVSDGTLVLYDGRVLVVFSADEPVEHGGNEPISTRRVFKFFDQKSEQEVKLDMGVVVRCQKLVDTGHRRG